MNPPHSPLSATSPVLPSLQNLSLGSGYPSDYAYNGVFAPPPPPHSAGPHQPQRGWTASPNKRALRQAIPSAWYDPMPSPSGAVFDAFRRDASSPPALSPPSSTTSGPTASHPYPSYQPTPAYPIDHAAFGLAPSPPPSMSYGLAGATVSPYGAGALPTYGSHSLASLRPGWRYGGGGGAGVGASVGGMGASMGAGMGIGDDDVIPTAIVIKNIPFAVSREVLLSIIESLGAPLPYAFNYHHDNGVFRGLAFANFRAPDEAASVVAALNGYDVQGRKLRVEYKKVLQPGEKDRIEREKAIKRMKSMQLDGVVTPLGAGGGVGIGGAIGGAPAPAALARPDSSQYAHHPHHAHVPTPLSLGPRNGNGSGAAYGLLGDEHSPPHSAASTANSAEHVHLPVALDLNDPSTLSIYNLVYMFREDRMRDELALSRTLSPTERRIVHLVAQKLGLTSVTMGDGDGAHVVVTKDAPRPQLTSSASASAAAASSATASAYLSPYAPAPPDPLSPGGLRIKKSMPDLRGFNGPVVARDPSRSLTPQRSSGNLRDGAAGAGGGLGLGGPRDYASMGATGGRRANGLGSGTFGYFGTSSHGSGNSNGNASSAVPPVPPLPAHLGGPGSASSSTSPDASAPSPAAAPGAAAAADAQPQPLRNPRGPVGEGRGFGNIGTGSLGNLRLAPAHSHAHAHAHAQLRTAASMQLGRRVSEEDEEEPRTREEIDL
ncbi:Peptidyl-prolyl cis-trans isomerase pin4 [Cryptotrichosporon argae]